MRLLREVYDVKDLADTPDEEGISDIDQVALLHLADFLVFAQFFVFEELRPFFFFVLRFYDLG